MTRAADAAAVSGNKVITRHLIRRRSPHAEAIASVARTDPNRGKRTTNVSGHVRLEALVYPPACRGGWMDGTSLMIARVPDFDRPERRTESRQERRRCQGVGFICIVDVWRLESRPVRVMTHN